MRGIIYLISLLAGCASCGNDAVDTPLPPPPPPPPAGEVTLALQTIATGLSSPLFLTTPLGDPRLFVVEKNGRIRIVKNGLLLPTPFLDISSKVSNGGEQGLLGLAFHPRYASNGIFVVNYTDTDGDTRVATYRVSAEADRADAASEQLVISIDQPFSNHNGGQVSFGPDGMLFIGTGDGGSGGDPQGNGQDRSDLLGSLLRLEILDNGNAQVPASNPFAALAGMRPELWNYGLRNPWRFAFDRANGDLYIADVGQGLREEVNVSTAATGTGKGLNYGWAAYEGTRCFGSPGACTGSGFVMPVIEYDHGDGCSITGGYVYRGTAIPALQGTYFYSDYCSAWIRSFRFANGQATERTEWATLKQAGEVLSFGEDAAGELYILSSSGTVYRIVRGS